jgi:hypothetical protein
MRKMKATWVKASNQFWRRKDWNRQRRTAANSRTFGMPSHWCTNIFDFTTWEGVAASVPVEILEPRYRKQLTPALSPAQERHYELDRRSVAWDQEAYVFTLPNGRVVSPYQAILTEQDVYLEDESYEFHSYQILDRRFFAERRNLPPVKHVSGTVAHISAYGDDGNIFHFIHNSLPRLALVQQSPWADKVDQYYVSTDQFSFIRSTLDLLEIPESKRIYGNHVPHIEAENLIATTRPDRFGNLELWNFELVRNLLLSKLGERKPKEKIYISRKTASQRRVTNEEELVQTLVGQGFKIVVMDELTVKEQAETMRDASVVIGAHGANLTFINLIDPGTVVVELFPRNYVVSCYYQLAAMAGATYSYVLDEATPNPDLTNLVNYATDDMSISIPKLLNTLATVQVEAEKRSQFATVK